MNGFDLADIATMTGGRLYGESVIVPSVSTDTRSLTEGQLFVALRGARFDGHDFIEKGRARYAGAVLVARRIDTTLPQIVVDDTETALARFAEAWRERLSMPVVGLTGSNGKTTVKEMIAAILAVDARVHATQGNLNNHIGVPLTLLALRPEHQYAVVEMGANHPGEIGGLTDLVHPDVALINNAAPAHLEGFRDLRGVAEAKGEIFNGLSPGGVGVINADDPFADYWSGLVARRRRLTFGLENAADVSGVWSRDATLPVKTPRGEVALHLPLPGRHNALNALAATTCAIALEIPLEQIRTGLKSMRPVRGRLVPRPGKNGSWILDDSYNANPASFRAGVEVLVARPGPRWLVLGDMGELGSSGRQMHAKAGDFARDAGVDRLFTLGPLSAAAADAFGPGGRAFKDVDVLVSTLLRDLPAGASVLVKGSRAMRMERVVDRLHQSDEGPRSNGGAEDAA